MQKTTLAPSALPGQTYTFVAKTEAEVAEVPTIAATVYGPNPAATVYAPNPTAPLEADR